MITDDTESPTASSTTTTENSSSSNPSNPSMDPISWPPNGELTLDWVVNVMAVFDWVSRNLKPAELPRVLPVSVFDSIVLTGSKLLHKEPNCVRVDDIGEDTRVVIVGDVHGQLHDVLFLLRDAGLPSGNRVFVFNGDYVDRGAWGLETFVLLLCWKVAVGLLLVPCAMRHPREWIFLPNRVYLLRGNHESKYCTTVYGFEKEVMAKYGDQGKHVYRKCLGCFEGLPLASVIAGRVYTAHGGLFRSVAVTPTKRPKGKKRNRKLSASSEQNKLALGSFEELNKARRSVLDPPWEGHNLIPGDVLWSDPSMSPGLSPNKERGIGLIWGPDCTENFLKEFQLKLIIRSHEGPDAREKRPGLGGMSEGYTIDHVVESGKLITLFSAPDYPQFQATEERFNNKGAYIVLEPPNFDTPVFRVFEAVSPRPKGNPYYDYEDVIDSDEELDLLSMVSS
ncbi:Serine/threonine-protein phosphatase 7-like protein [Drosera capensis]